MTQPVEILYAVPVGTVISWFPPPGAQTDKGYTLPPGFALCDGSIIQDPNSPFSGKPTPDLRGAFVLGADPAVPVGQTYGTDGTNSEGWNTPTLYTSSTEASSNDSVTPSIIQDQNPNGSYRYVLTQDSDNKHDGNHHHQYSFYLPPPYSLALLYIIRVV